MLANDLLADLILEYENESQEYFECYECGGLKPIAAHVGYQICRNCSLNLIESRRYL